jgi:hypothetical protein
MRNETEDILLFAAAGGRLLNSFFHEKGIQFFEERSSPSGLRILAP